MLHVAYSWKWRIWHITNNKPGNIYVNKINWIKKERKKKQRGKLATVWRDQEVLHGKTNLAEVNDEYNFDWESKWASFHVEATV